MYSVKSFSFRDLLEVSHIRTIYNIFVAILIVFSLNTLAYDYIEHGRYVAKSINLKVLLIAEGMVSLMAKE